MTSPKSVKVSKTDATTGRGWTARPILGPEFTEVPPLQEVYVGILKRRRDTSTAIQSVSAVLPGFAHLKRCSNGRLLLAPLSTDDVSLGEDRLKARLQEKGFDLSLLEDRFQVTRVPAKAPRTKSQASEASRIWPVNFHPDPTIEGLIDGSVFDEDRLNAIGRIMSLVIEAARLEAVGDERCTGAAAVVDPEDGRILAVSAARLDRHPMWHAAMLAVDLVAKLQGGGAWRLDDDDDDDDDDEEPGETARGRTDDVDDVDVEERTLGDGQRAAMGSTAAREDVRTLKTRLRRIKRRYEEETPLCYPRSLSALPLPAQTSLESREIARKGRKEDNGARTEHQRPNETDDEERDDNGARCNGPYLCTGYWVFLLTEPCPLCAMALLHSRVARIFYGAANPRAGVLGSRAILHTAPGLNHRYRVWSGVLERECRQTVDEINARGSRRG